MKKGLIAFVLATGMVFADDANLPLPTLDANEKNTKTTAVIPETPKDDSENFNRRFIPYVKLGPDFMNVGHSSGVSPNMGLGIRSESNADAVDISISYSSRLDRKEGQDDELEAIMFCPKILYHRFLNPTSPSSFFYGAGGSWGTLRNDHIGKEFTGLFGDLSVGFEAGRNTMIRQIVQCNLTQPILAYKQKGGLSTPSLEVSYSLGF